MRRNVKAKPPSAKYVAALKPAPPHVVQNLFPECHSASLLFAARTMRAPKNSTFSALYNALLSALTAPPIRPLQVRHIALNASPSAKVIPSASIMSMLSAVYGGLLGSMGSATWHL